MAKIVEEKKTAYDLNESLKVFVPIQEMMANKTMHPDVVDTFTWEFENYLEKAEKDGWEPLESETEEDDMPLDPPELVDTKRKLPAKKVEWMSDDERWQRGP